MASSVNKVILIGNVGKDPEIRSFQNGGRVANLSIATSESWKDKASGEKKEKTEWHRVVIFNDNLVNVVENYVKKGDKLYLEGQLETREWEDKDGQKKYSTEVVLRPYRGEITLLGGGRGGNAGGGDSAPSYEPAGASAMGGGASKRAAIDELEDDIPF